MTRRGWMILWALLLLPITLLILRPGGCVTPPSDNSYVGVTKAEAEEHLGNPTSEWDGHYGLPPMAWAQEHPHCVTCTWSKWHGTLYVTFEQKDGKWVGLCSNWLPKGGAF